MAHYYSVNTQIGFCTCPKGRDGSPCLHQAAVVVQYGEYGLNFATSMSSSARQKLAQVPLGDGHHELSSSELCTIHHLRLECHP